MLTDPRPALAEQSNFHHALLGLAGLAELVHALAEDRPVRDGSQGEPDNFVHLLLGIASLGATIERLGRSGDHPRPTADPPDPVPAPAHRLGWLR